MTAETIMTWAGWVGSGILGAAACYERFRNRQKDETKEVVKLLSTERDAWKSMTETVRVELDDYRKQTHAKLDEANAKLLTLTAENERLKAATDVTPILKHQEEQSQINVKMLTALDEVLAHLRAFRAPHTRKSKTKIKP